MLSQSVCLYVQHVQTISVYPISTSRLCCWWYLRQILTGFYSSFASGLSGKYVIGKQLKIHHTWNASVVWIAYNRDRSTRLLKAPHYDWRHAQKLMLNNLSTQSGCQTSNKVLTPSAGTQFQGEPFQQDRKIHRVGGKILWFSTEIAVWETVRDRRMVAMEH